MSLQSQTGVLAPDVEGAALADEMMPRTATGGSGEKLTLDDSQDRKVT